MANNYHRNSPLKFDNQDHFLYTIYEISEFYIYAYFLMEKTSPFLLVNVFGVNSLSVLISNKKRRGKNFQKKIYQK